MRQIMIRGYEHEHLELTEYSEEIKERISKLIKSGQEKNKKLGLYYSQNGKIRPGNFIGAIWIGENDVLRVDSKFTNPNMDYIKMFTECCEHQIIGERMFKCFECWPDEKLIELPNADDFSIMIVIAYLRELNTLCVRHLRRHFERRQENFIGKVKGKILIGENIRRNVVRARPDRVYCEYQAISDDILENRILRAALERAARYISQDKIAKNYEYLHRWVHACRAHLQGVSVTHISNRQFSAARNRGVFSFYRRPLNLAKSVLRRFGFNPHEEINELTQTPPYAIDSTKLFECYAELHFRNKFQSRKLSVQKTISDPDVKVIPDFYFSRADGEPWIIDAKYKEIENSKDSLNQDFYQVVAYSRHRALLERINENTPDKEKPENESGIKLSLAYPYITKSPEEVSDNEPKEETINAFLSPITIYKIPCPAK